MSAIAIMQKDSDELNRTQAAAFFGVGVETLDKYVKEYKIPYRQFKNRKFFRLEDLKEAKSRMSERK